MNDGNIRGKPITKLDLLLLFVFVKEDVGTVEVSMAIASKSVIIGELSNSVFILSCCLSSVLFGCVSGMADRGSGRSCV